MSLLAKLASTAGTEPRENKHNYRKPPTRLGPAPGVAQHSCFFCLNTVGVVSFRPHTLEVVLGLTWEEVADNEVEASWSRRASNHNTTHAR